MLWNRKPAYQNYHEAKNRFLHKTRIKNNDVITLLQRTVIFVLVIAMLTLVAHWLTASLRSGDVLYFRCSSIDNTRIASNVGQPVIVASREDGFSFLSITSKTNIDNQVVCLQLR